MHNVLNSALTLGVLWAIHLGYSVGRRTRRFHLRLLGLLKVKALPAPPTQVETIDVLDSLSEADFLKDYLLPNKPVIVRGSCSDWKARDTWTHAALADRYGNLEVPIQGEYFNRLNKQPMRKFLEALPKFDATVEDALHPGEEVPYMRYESTKVKMQHVYAHFGLLHKVSTVTARMFRDLKTHWSLPTFLPASGYSYPFTWFSTEPPNVRMFHDFGIYISGRGACTKLHADGTRTNAVLCQVQGTKSGFIFPATAEPFLHHAEHWDTVPKFADCTDVQRSELAVKPIRFELNTGDVIFVPRNWAHEVYTESASVTLTYNFLWGWRELLACMWQLHTRGKAGAYSALPPSTL